MLEGSDLDSGSKSDGLGALRAVEAMELKENGRNGVRGPENKTLQHWHEPKPTLDQSQKEPYCWEFGCRYCSARPVLGNLATHTKRHEAKIAAAPSNEPPTTHQSTHGSTAASAKLMEGYLKQGKLNPRIVPTQSGFLKMFATWLLEDDLAWTTGKSPGLIRLFKYMQINFMLPSNTTVQNTVARICQDLHKSVVQELASVKLKISYSQDTWTTKQMVFSFSLTMDNSTSNDVLARSLATLLIKHNIEFDAKSGQIRCLPHVINLVIQRILSKLSSGDVADPDINDYYEEAKKHSVHYDPNSDPDIQEMEEEYLNDENEGSSKADSSDEDELSDSDSNIELPGLSTQKAPIAKLRHIDTKIVSSPQRRYTFRQQVRQFYENLRLMVIRDVKTRWNCTHAMIKRALILQNAINTWVLSIPELHPYALTKSDWKVLAATEELLQPFTNITRDMSQSGTPMLCYAIPFYRHMKRHLTASSENSQLTSLGGFQNAIVAGLAKLER
ncbi:hypothetical protein FRC00_001502 [Tulasnella sp. 408]|nr:hypothetical protein FRC00_001502 [Tulasnella sp. 408]